MAAIATPLVVGQFLKASKKLGKRRADAKPPRNPSDIWTSAGGEASALDALTLTGDEPQLPSSFRVAAAAQVSVAATGLAAAEIWKMRSGEAQDVAVDMRHAVVECRSERYLRVDGKPPPPAWDAIAGVYKTRDGFVRLHTNFPHHRDAVCKVLNCKPERDAVQAALMQWDGEAFETAAYAGGCVVAFMRSHDQWSATPHAKALAGLPLISIAKIGEAAPKPWPEGERPLAGIRVLDLSRVIAGPVAGRTLAAHGADVLLISGPELPAIPWLTIDTGRGKLTSFVELKNEQGRGGACAICWRRRISFRKATGRARSPASASRRRMPRASIPVSFMSRCRPMVHAGPWAERRGFELAGADGNRIQPCRGAGRRCRWTEGIAGANARPRHRLLHGVRRHDGQGAPGA